jgi:hypothetical protein
LPSKPYWLAPEAGAAIAADEASEAAAEASEAAPDAEAAASEAAAAESDAPAAASEAAGAEAADVSLAAPGAVWSLFLLQAAKAMAASSEATRRDFFMITSFYG